ncbi:MAG: hypothetical protein K2X91_01300, partial [Thermoleophilia bacterium]|nr:hypothetical protein [Thermoleophilia bacterium]
HRFVLPRPDSDSTKPGGNPKEIFRESAGGNNQSAGFEYKGCTSFVITCDHGRGGEDPPGYQGGRLSQWTDHGARVVGAEQTWIMVIGPDTPSMGELKDAPPVTQSQIAATIAALVGYDYPAAEPRAAPAIEGAVRAAPSPAPAR